VEPSSQYLADAPLEQLPFAADAQRETPIQRDASHRRAGRPQTVHTLTDEVILGGFDPTFVGEALLELADRDDGVERAGEYAAIIAKARLSRRDRDRRADI
jgi:hypothetical protein